MNMWAVEGAFMPASHKDARPAPPPITKKCPHPHMPAPHLACPRRALKGTGLEF